MLPRIKLAPLHQPTGVQKAKASECLALVGNYRLQRESRGSHTCLLGRNRHPANMQYQSHSMVIWPEYTTCLPDVEPGVHVHAHHGGYVNIA